ncbi:hypothetical protein ACLOJK_002000 [Asimina triloba]
MSVATDQLLPTALEGLEGCREKGQEESADTGVSPRLFINDAEAKEPKLLLGVSPIARPFVGASDSTMDTTSASDSDIFKSQVSSLKFQPQCIGKQPD